MISKAGGGFFLAGNLLLFGGLLRRAIRDGRNFIQPFFVTGICSLIDHRCVALRSSANQCESLSIL